MRKTDWMIRLAVLVMLASQTALGADGAPALSNLDVATLTALSEGSLRSLRTVGWAFTVTGPEDIRVTDLGMYAHGGQLRRGHSVGLWEGVWDEDSQQWVWNEVPLRSVVVGPDDDVEENYLYAGIEPVQLPAGAGKAYTVAVQVGPVDPPVDDIIQYADPVQVASVIEVELLGGFFSRYKESEDFSRPDDYLIDQEGYNANFQFEIVPDVIAVDIDIKPGSYPNSINLGSNGVVPVAILSSTEFDATTVDPSTVTLAGAGVAVRGKGDKLLASTEDVNGDGLLDLSLKVETENLDPGTFQDGYAILAGETYGGEAIEGRDEITIVPE